MIESLLEILRGRIQKARKDIKNNGGNEAFSKFVKSEKGKYSGFSKSNISYILSEINKQTDGKNLESFEEKVKELELAILDFIEYRRKTINNFYNTRWYLYSFYSRPSRNVMAALSRVVLSIDTFGKVYVKNHDGNRDYEGTFQLVKNRLLFFDLQHIRKSESRVHMKIVSSESPKEISLGGFISYEDESIHSGTCIIEHKGVYKDEPSLLPQLFSTQGKDFFSEVPYPIRRYLSLKSQNHLKIPNDNFTINDLEDFMRNTQQNKKGLFFDYDNPEVFISSPTDSISPGNHKENSKTISSIINSVKKKLVSSDIHITFKYPGQENEEDVNEEGGIDRIQEYRKRIIKVMDDLKRTRFFILIYNEKAISRSLIELGWALAYCKAVLVLYKNDSKFPNNISVLEDSKKLSYFKMYPFQDLKENQDQLISKIYYTIIENLIDQYHTDFR